MRKRVFLCFFLLLSCVQQEIQAVDMDNLAILKDEFIQQIYQSDVQEGPFRFNYEFKTIFFSKEVVSLFGEIIVHDRLPHGWQYYEGKTFCTINNHKREVILQDLFPLPEHKEYLRQTCENSLKQLPISYFAGKEPLHTTLELNDIQTFVIDDKSLFIIFQPYRVGSGVDGPFIVTIPFSHLKGHWDENHPLHSLMKNAIEANDFITTIDGNSFFESENIGHCL